MFRNLVCRLNQDQPDITLNSKKYMELRAFLQHLHEDGDNRILYKNNVEVSSMVVSAVRDLLRQGETILQKLIGNDAIIKCDSIDESVDESIKSASPAGELEELFSETVQCVAFHPMHHHFAQTAYEPNHHASFQRVLKSELVGLRNLCSTETRTEMGIKARSFEDRMVSISF